MLLLRDKKEDVTTSQLTCRPVDADHADPVMPCAGRAAYFHRGPRVHVQRASHSRSMWLSRLSSEHTRLQANLVSLCLAHSNV